MKKFWTKKILWTYLNDPDKSLDKHYIKLRQKSRKELRRMVMETKAKGGVVDLNYIFNDFIKYLTVYSLFKLE